MQNLTQRQKLDVLCKKYLAVARAMGIDDKEATTFFQSLVARGFV